MNQPFPQYLWARVIVDGPHNVFHPEGCAKFLQLNESWSPDWPSINHHDLPTPLAHHLSNHEPLDGLMEPTIDTPFTNHQPLIASPWHFCRFSISRSGKRRANDTDGWGKLENLWRCSSLRVPVAATLELGKERHDGWFQSTSWVILLESKPTFQAIVCFLSCWILVSSTSPNHSWTMMNHSSSTTNPHH